MSSRGALPYELTRRVRDSCLCLHAQRAARALARRFDKALRPLQLKSGQFSLLMALNRPEPPGIGDVAALLAMDRTTLTANLKPLERRGLIEVTVDARDKRGRRLALTAAGHAMLIAAMPIWEEAHAAASGCVPDSQIGALHSGLRALSGDLARWV